MASIFKQLAVIAILAGGGAWAWITFGEPEAQTVEAVRRQPPGVIVAEAKPGQVERVVSAVGTGRALRSVELRFSVDGRVQEMLFADGQQVKAGDPLARLDDGAERAALKEAEADLHEAQAAFDRSEALRQQGRVTASVFDAAEAALHRAEARLDRAKQDLDYRTLRAPFDGVIGFSAIDPGAVVTAATPVATIDDISELDVEFAVPERFFREVTPGDAVRARTRIFPDEEFEGEVIAIDRRVDEVSRAFRVRARFENPGLRLPAGAFMQVELVLESREGVLAPEESLVTEAGTIHLFVLGEDGRIQRRAVTLGARRAGYAEVLDGLAPGERVVVRGVQKVRDGAPARVLEEIDTGDASPEARADGARSAG